MLLDYMRKNTKRFLYVAVPLISVSFVLWGTVPDFGQRGQRTLMEVGGEKVSMDKFANYYKALRQNARRNLGTNFTPEIEKMLNLKQQTMDGLVREIILEQEVERLKIVVSDAEVQDTLKRDASFQTDGQFDPAKWNAAITDPRNNWDAIAEQQRRFLRTQKLVEIVRSGAKVTGKEIEEAFRRDNEKAKIEYVAFKVSDLKGEVEILPEDIIAYYDKHSEEYIEPARVKLAFVELEKEPSEKDLKDVKDYAEKILERARAGDDFAGLAEDYSEDTASKTKGGDLGFFRRGRMVKEFDEVAFALKPGEISELVKTRFGFHIIKLEEIKGEGDDMEISARHILLKTEPSDDTILSLHELANRLADAARKSSLADAAKELELEMGTSASFAESNKAIPGIGYAPEIADLVPGLQEGKASDVIDAQKGFYVVEIVERTPERVQELEEVEDRVRAALEMEKALELAEVKAEEVISKVKNNGGSFGGIDGIPEPQEPEPFTRQDYPRDIPYVTELMEAAFRLEEGEAAGPFVERGSAYVVLSKGKVDPAPSEFEEKKDSIKERLLMERQGQVFQDYYESLRDRVGVKIDDEMLATL